MKQKNQAISSQKSEAKASITSEGNLQNASKTEENQAINRLKSSQEVMLAFLDLLANLHQEGLCKELKVSADEAIALEDLVERAREMVRALIGKGHVTEVGKVSKLFFELFERQFDAIRKLTQNPDVDVSGFLHGTEDGKATVLCQVERAFDEEGNEVCRFHWIAAEAEEQAA